MIITSTRTAAVLAVLCSTFHSFSGAAAAPSSGWASVVRSCTQDNVVALTFDDGPYIYTSQAMDILEAHGAKGTFFVNGYNWGCIYDKVDILKEIVDRHHQVASHTWSHGHLPQRSYAEIDQELTRTHQAIERITGASVAFMRPPYGEFNDNVREIAGKLGETIVTWDFDSGDSVGKSVPEQQQGYVTAVSSRPRNILSLQHDVHQTSVRDVLPAAIKTLQDAGYRLVTVAECLGQQPYHYQGQPQSRTSDWHC